MGILHRDVKLENLLCDTSTRPPRVKLCDFGHAVTKRDLPHDRQFYGTPGYAAPEVMQGPVWTPKADVWAMGVVMYALLANALPFECEEGWRRPADLSSRVWWRVSLEAKLLLQVREMAGAAWERTTHRTHYTQCHSAPPHPSLSTLSLTPPLFQLSPPFNSGLARAAARCPRLAPHIRAVRVVLPTYGAAA